MESAKLLLVILSVYVSLAASQYIDVDGATASQPDYLTGGAVGTVIVDLSFTPMDGAAAIIEASAVVNRFLVVGVAAETDDGSGSFANLDSASLTNSEQTTNLTDGTTVTWEGLTFSANLTEEDCGNGTLLQYYCIAIMPHSSASWGAIDYNNASICLDIKCKAVVDVGMSSITISNPDDGILSLGGGQAIEFTAAVTSDASSDDVVGAYNWKATTFLSNSETGSGTEVASTSLVFTSAQVTKDLTAGDSISLAGIAATYDLTDVTCDDFCYACVTLEPHASANWRLDDVPSLNQTVCTSVTCGAGFTGVSLVVMIACFIMHHLMNYS